MLPRKRQLTDSGDESSDLETVSLKKPNSVVGRKGIDDAQVKLTKKMIDDDDDDDDNEIMDDSDDGTAFNRSSARSKSKPNLATKISKHSQDSESDAERDNDDATDSEESEADDESENDVADAVAAVDEDENLIEAFSAPDFDKLDILNTHNIPGYGVFQKIVGVRRVPIHRVEHSFLTKTLFMTLDDPESADDCLLCRKGGDLLCCDTCDRVFHPFCVELESAPDGDYRCELCLGTKTQRQMKQIYIVRMQEKNNIKKTFKNSAAGKRARAEREKLREQRREQKMKERGINSTKSKPKSSPKSTDNNDDDEDDEEDSSDEEDVSEDSDLLSSDTEEEVDYKEDDIYSEDDLDGSEYVIDPVLNDIDKQSRNKKSDIKSPNNNNDNDDDDDNDVKLLLGGGPHRTPYFEIEAKKNLYSQDSNSPTSPVTPTSLSSSTTSFLGSAKKGNIQTPKMKQLIKSAVKSAEQSRGNTPKTYRNTVASRIDNGIGVWDIDDVFFRDVNTTTCMEAFDGPFYSHMKPHDYIMQTQYLVKLKGHSYRKCMWIPRVIMRHYRNLFIAVRKYHKKTAVTTDIEAIEDNDEDGAYFNPDFYNVEKILFIDSKTQLSLVKWTGLPYSECTVENDDILLEEVDVVNKYIRDSVTQEVDSEQSSNSIMFSQFKKIKHGRDDLDDTDSHTHTTSTSSSSAGDDNNENNEDEENIERTRRANKLASIPDGKRKWIVECVFGLKFENGRALRHYQEDGLIWLVFNALNNRNSILADEMGLGKTMQSVSYIKFFNDVLGQPGPSLILAPLSTLPHWQREVENCSTMNAIVYQGDAENRQFIRDLEFYPLDKQGYAVRDKDRKVKFNILICSYETFLSDCSFLNRIRWNLLVVDEAQRLKNSSGRFYQTLIRMKFRHKLLLTGTPIQNNLSELWSLLHFLDNVKFSSEDTFLEEFGTMETSSQVESLHDILRPYLLRRLKGNVEKSLKPLKETIVEIELTPLQKKYYKAVYERNTNILFSMAKNKANLPSLMNVAMQLRKCCNHPFLLTGVEDTHMAQVYQDIKKHRQLQLEYDANPKSKPLAEALASTDPIIAANAKTAQEKLRQKGDILASVSCKLKLLDKLLPRLQRDGHKVLLFSQMTRVLDIIEDYLYCRSFKYERVDGSVHGYQRQQAIDRFSKPDSQSLVFLLSTRAGGVGINLTAADTVVIFDSDWNPQQDIQAQARAHRIGQKKAVRVFRLLAKDTYEMKMFKEVSRKLGLDKAVLQSMAKSVQEKKEASFIESAEDGKKKAAIPNSQKIEELLKHGAYGILMDENTGSNEITDDDIDKILLGNSAMSYDQEKDLQTDAEGNAFNKATFVDNTSEDSKIEINDPDFWSKLGLKTQVVEENLGKRKRFAGQYSKLDSAAPVVDADYNVDGQESSSDDDEGDYANESVTGNDLNSDIKAKARNQIQSQLKKKSQGVSSSSTSQGSMFDQASWNAEVTSDPSTWNSVQVDRYNRMCGLIGYTPYASTLFPVATRAFICALMTHGYGQWSRIRRHIISLLAENPRVMFDPRLPPNLTASQDIKSLCTNEDELMCMTLLQSMHIPLLNLTDKALVYYSLSLFKQCLLTMIRSSTILTQAHGRNDGPAFNKELLRLCEYTDIWKQPELLFDLRCIIDPINGASSVAASPAAKTESSDETSKSTPDVVAMTDDTSVKHEPRPITIVASESSANGYNSDDDYTPDIPHLDLEHPCLQAFIVTDPKLGAPVEDDEENANNNYLYTRNSAYGSVIKHKNGSLMLKQPPSYERIVSQPNSGPIRGMRFASAYPYVHPSQTPPFGPRLPRPYFSQVNNTITVMHALLSPEIAPNPAFEQPEMTDFIQKMSKGLLQSVNRFACLHRMFGRPILSTIPASPPYSQIEGITKILVPEVPTPSVMLTDVDLWSGKPINTATATDANADASAANDGDGDDKSAVKAEKHVYSVKYPPPAPLFIDKSIPTEIRFPMPFVRTSLFPPVSKTESFPKWYNSVHDRHLLAAMMYLGLDVLPVKVGNTYNRSRFVDALILHTGFCFLPITQGRGWPARSEDHQRLMVQRGEELQKEVISKATVANQDQPVPVPQLIDEDLYPIMPFTTIDKEELKKFLTRRCKTLVNALPSIIRCAVVEEKHKHQATVDEFNQNKKRLSLICDLIHTHADQHANELGAILTNALNQIANEEKCKGPETPNIDKLSQSKPKQPQQGQQQGQQQGENEVNEASKAKQVKAKDARVSEFNINAIRQQLQDASINLKQHTDAITQFTIQNNLPSDDIQKPDIKEVIDSGRAFVEQLKSFEPLAVKFVVGDAYKLLKFLSVILQSPRTAYYCSHVMGLCHEMNPPEIIAFATHIQVLIKSCQATFSARHLMSEKLSTMITNYYQLSVDKTTSLIRNLDTILHFVKLRDNIAKIKSQIASLNENLSAALGGDSTN